MTNPRIRELQDHYERMQDFIQGLPAHIYNNNQEHYQQILIDLDKDIDELIAHEEQRPHNEILCTEEKTCLHENSSQLPDGFDECYDCGVVFYIPILDLGESPTETRNQFSGF